MAIPEDALYNRLSNDAAVSAIVSTRIFPYKLAQNCNYPALVYTFIDKIPAQAMGTASTLFFARVQIDSWAKTVAEVKNLANKVRNSLDALDATLSGIRVYGMMFLSEIDLYETDTELYRISQDYKFIFTQS